MKSTGIVRKIDELGRIVLPKELRENFDLNFKDAVEIYTEKDTIILRKYAPNCVFCGGADSIVSFKGKNVCQKCLKELKK